MLPNPLKQGMQRPPHYEYPEQHGNRNQTSASTKLFQQPFPYHIKTYIFEETKHIPDNVR